MRRAWVSSSKAVGSPCLARVIQALARASMPPPYSSPAGPFRGRSAKFSAKIGGSGSREAEQVAGRTGGGAARAEARGRGVELADLTRTEGMVEQRLLEVRDAGGARTLTVEAGLPVDRRAGQQVDGREPGHGEQVRRGAARERVPDAVHDRGGQAMVQEVDQHRARDRQGRARARELGVETAQGEADPVAGAGGAQACLKLGAQVLALVREDDRERGMPSVELACDLQDPRQ